jgi:hypothetical protein
MKEIIQAQEIFWAKYASEYFRRVLVVFFLYNSGGDSVLLCS